MSYKMNCYRCGEEMKYSMDVEMEQKGFVAMDCPNGCENGYLVPINNPHLIKLEQK